MIIVSHRGNLFGPNKVTENSPTQIDLAINNGYLVEVDVRIKNQEIWLGHDDAQYKIDFNWLVERNQKLIIHAKDLVTCDELAKEIHTLNWFYHTDEDLVLTSKGWLWAYPGVYLRNAITVLPNNNLNFPEDILGVCTDFPQLIKFKS